jgi:uncharacterized repeat protein (TIGR01451 family)
MLTMTNKEFIQMRFLSLITAFILIAVLIPIPVHAACPTTLTVNITSGPYLLVDSNNPGTAGPMVATLSAVVKNIGANTANNVYVYIGNGTTPGTFPIGADGHSLSLLGGVADATRYIVNLTPGQSKTIFWQVTYWPEPNKFIDHTYSFTVWVNNEDGCTASDTHNVTTTHTISANANKLLGTVTRNPVSGIVNPGNILTVTLTNFNFGTVGSGYGGEEDAWMQPVGNLSFDPNCFRLIKTEVNVQSVAGTPVPPYYTMPLFDQGYLTGIGSTGSPPNYGYTAGDYVHYSFIAVKPCVSTVQPYNQVASGTQEKYSGDFAQAGTTITVTSNPGGLDFSKSVNPTTGRAGDTLTWTITYGNTTDYPIGDPSTGNGLVVLDEAVPDHTTYVAGSSTCTGYTCVKLFSTDYGTTWTGIEPPAASVTAIKWYINQAVAAHTTGTVSFQTTIDPGTPDSTLICNTASAMIGEGPPLVSDNICANGAAILNIDKTWQDLNGGSPEPGDIIRYTISYSNTGNADAAGAFITDDYDETAFSLISNFQQTGGLFTTHTDSGPGLLRWPSGSGTVIVPSGVSGSVSYDATLNSTFPSGTTDVNNTACIEPTDPNVCDNVTVQVTAETELTIEKTWQDLNGGIVKPGDIIRYTISYENSGDSPATGAFITDDYDETAFSLISNFQQTGGLFSTHTDSGTNLRWPSGAGAVTIPADTSGSVSYDATLNPSFPAGTTNVINTACIEPADPNVCDNVTVPVVAAYNLTMDKTWQDLNGGAPEPGDIIRYTVSYSNTGNGPATGAFIADDYDQTAFSLISNFQQTGGHFGTTPDNDGSRLRWPDAPGSVTIPAGASGSVSYDATLNSSFPAGTTNISNTACIEPTDPDLCDTTTVPVIAAYNLTMDKTWQDLNGGVPEPGDVIRYTVSYSNTGNADAPGALVTDDYDETAFSSLSNFTQTGGLFTSYTDSGTSLRWPSSPGTVTIPAGTNGSVSYDATLNSSLSPGNVSNTACIEPTDPDLCDTATVPVVTDNLTIEKTWQDLNGGSPQPGDVIRYTISYSNTGGADADDAFITDDYDETAFSSTENFTEIGGLFTTHTDSGPGLLRWPSGSDNVTIPAGASGSVSYDATLNSAFPAGTTNVSNTACIKDNLCASTTVPVIAFYNLIMDKMWQDLNGGSPQPGDTIRYTINYSNTGKADATGAFITDDYDETAFSSTDNFTETGGHFGTTPDDDGSRLRWPSASGSVTIPAGASGSVSYDATLNSSFPPGTTQVNNRACIEPSLDLCNSTTVPIMAAYFLTIDKTWQDLNGDDVHPGDTIRYTISYSNTGDAYFLGAFITDDYDETAFSSTDNFTETGGLFTTHTDSGTSLHWPSGSGTVTIPAGTGGSVSYDATLSSSLPSGNINNTACIEPNDPSVCHSANVPVVAIPNLTIVKTWQDLDDDDVRPGDTIRYTITYSNTGRVDAPGAFITDDYDETAFAFTDNFTEIGGLFTTHTDSGTSLRWPSGSGTVTIPAGASGSVSYDGILRSTLPAGNVDNTVCIEPTNPDVCDNITVPVTSISDLIIEKTWQDLNGDGVQPGDTIRYTINYSNTGGAAATGAFITDDYDETAFSLIANVQQTGGLFTTHTDSGTSLRWPSGSDNVTVPSGASGSISYDATLNSTFPAGTTNFRNTACIESTDPTICDIVIVPVTAAYNININKMWQDLNGGDVLTGDTIRYTISYTNTGNAPADGAFIADDYDETAFSSLSNFAQTGGLFTTHTDSGTSLRWPSGSGTVTIPAGASGSVSYDAKLNFFNNSNNVNVDNSCCIGPIGYRSCDAATFIVKQGPSRPPSSTQHPKVSPIGSSGMTSPVPICVRYYYPNICPKRARIGEPVAISVNLTNNCNENRTQDINLSINGRMEQTKTISISPQATTQVNFTVTETQPGTYKVAIGDQRDSFTVLPPGYTEASYSQTRTVAVILFMVFMVLLTIILLLLAFRRFAQ